MTIQGTARAVRTRIQRRNLFQAELCSAKLERAAVRWHARLETESVTLTLTESQLALAALASLCAGERDALKILRGVLRQARPTLLPQVS